MSQLRSFTASTARPLPVLVLADTSGSMSVDGKIEALNTALADMVRSFASEDDAKAEIHVSIITFGGSACCDCTGASSASRTPCSTAASEGASARCT